MSLEAASIAQHCKTLRLAAIQVQFASLENLTHPRLSPVSN